MFCTDPPTTDFSTYGPTRSLPDALPISTRAQARSNSAKSTIRVAVRSAARLGSCRAQYSGYWPRLRISGKSHMSHPLEFGPAPLGERQNRARGIACSGASAERLRFEFELGFERLVEDREHQPADLAEGFGRACGKLPCHLFGARTESVVRVHLVR